MSPVSPALASGFFTTRATWEAHTLDTSSLLLGLFGELFSPYPCSVLQLSLQCPLVNTSS